LIKAIVGSNKDLLDIYKFHNLFFQLRGVNKEIRDNNLSKITYQNQPLNDIYDLYVEQHNIAHPRRKRRNPIDEIIHIEDINDYPFKSKIRYFDNEKLNDKPPDFKLNTLEKLQRPYFGPKLGSWELDVVYASSPTYKNENVY
jgi:hypothetical protein